MVGGGGGTVRGDSATSETEQALRARSDHPGQVQYRGSSRNCATREHSKRQVVVFSSRQGGLLAEAAGVLKSGHAAWRSMNRRATRASALPARTIAVLPGSPPPRAGALFAGWRHRLRDQRRGAGLHARPEPLGAGDRPARWAQKQAPQRPGGVDGPSRAPRHHPAPGASRSAEDRQRRRAVGQRGRPWPMLKDAVIVSDDAGQFNVSSHALCWVHAERLIHKLVGFNHRCSGRRVRGSWRGCGGSTPT